MTFNQQATPNNIDENESQNMKSTQENGNLDELISEAIGQFGKYQLIGLLVFTLYMVCIGPVNTEYAFTTARINTRCLVPECDKDYPEFAPPWILNAVPPSGSTFDSCTQYGPASSLPTNTSDVCPTSMFDNSTILKCAEWVYANQNTIVYEFNLGCDEWRRSIVGSARTAGCFINLALTGYISDRFGRKPALLFNSINVLWIGMLRSFSSSYWMFFVLEFAETSLGFSGYTSIVIILLELFGSKYRLAIGACSSSSYSFGQIYFALLAWKIPYWRYLTRAIYTQQLLPVAIALIAPESFRWLMVKQKYEEGLNTLIKVAKVNRRNISEKTLSDIKDEFCNNIEVNKQKRNIKQPWLPLLVWRHKVVLRRCLIAPILWMTLTLTTYGISLNAINLAGTGSRFLNYATAAAAEIPGHWTAYFLMSRYGRKLLLIIAYWVCAVCMIASACVGRDHPWLPLTLSLLGKYCIALVGASIYVYTAEIFPTSHRHTLLAFCSMIGRLGSVIAPLTPALGAQIWSELPYVVFGSCCVLSGSLMTLMPETRGARLPDTMDQVCTEHSSMESYASDATQPCLSPIKDQEVS